MIYFVTSIDPKPIAKNALTILINISGDRDVLDDISNDKDFLESLLLRITVCQFSCSSSIYVWPSLALFTSYCTAYTIAVLIALVIECERT